MQGGIHFKGSFWVGSASFHPDKDFGDPFPAPKLNYWDNFTLFYS